MNTRHDDPAILPAWLHKLAVLVKRRPVIAAFTVMVFTIGVPIANVIVQQAELREQNHAIQRQNDRIAGQNDRIAAQQGQIQQSRTLTVTAVCRAMNDQSLTVNGQNSYLQGILLGSVQQSRAFDQVYRRFGLPAYPDRLRQARTLAKALGSLAVRHVDCPQFAREVRGTGSTTVPYGPPRFPRVPGFPGFSGG